MYYKALSGLLFLLISDGLADFTKFGRERGLREDGSQANRRGRRGDEDYVTVEEHKADIQRIEQDMAGLTTMVDMLLVSMIDLEDKMGDLKLTVTDVEGVQSQHSTELADLTGRMVVLEEKMCFISLPKVGGNGGHWYSDWQTYAESGYAKISKIIVRAGDRVDRICVTYGSKEAPCFGGGGGHQYEIKFDADEYITEVFGRAMDRVDQIAFRTNKKLYGSYGGGGGKSYGFKASGRALAYISGRGDDGVDNLQFNFHC